MTEMKILINNDELILAHLRLDLSVEPELFVPVIKTSIIKAIVSSLSDFNSFNYTINKHLNGVLITVINGRKAVETSLSREDSLFLLKKCLENGCIFRIILKFPPIE